jgi:hypothetical protein
VPSGESRSWKSGEAALVAPSGGPRAPEGPRWASSARGHPPRRRQLVGVMMAPLLRQHPPPHRPLKQRAWL